jgi:F0F1-type ATP synthase assembly protein I
MIARDAATQRIAVRILTGQAASTLLIATLCLVLWGRAHALSALAGGTIGLIANAWMTLNALRPTASAAGALGRLMFGQLVKMVLTVVLLLAVAKASWARWPPIVFAYAATLMVYWLVPVLSMRTRRVKN